MMRKRIFLLLVLTGLALRVDAASDAGCWFMQMNAEREAAIALPARLESVQMAGYFRIYYPASDSWIADQLARRKPAIEQSRSVLERDLAWPMPATRIELGRPELDVYFINGPGRFFGTVIDSEKPAVVFNRDVLKEKDFAALWLHQLAHAAQLKYRKTGDYWFYEATAGWMESLSGMISRRTLTARQRALFRPGVSVTDSDPAAALGASRFVEMLARPYRDVIRQIWDQWTYPETGDLMEAIRRALGVNHLPDFESYLQNYFLTARSREVLVNQTTEIVLQPYSAAAFRGGTQLVSGGARVIFEPESAGQAYSAGLLYYSRGRSGGTLALRKSVSGSWSITVPFAGMDHYDLRIINSSSNILRGKVVLNPDASIPAVLEYFRVNPGEGGVQIEWKTARENGVAFWNLFRIEKTGKSLLNDFPIPASIDAPDGVHYLYIDTSDGAFYSLEAVTPEGLSSPFAAAETMK